MRPALKAFIVVLTLTFMAPPLFAAQRIFYEDCEDTSFSQYFLERHFGTAYKGYWNELTSELTRSTVAHNGSYSMTFNPWVTDNPHATIGLGDTKFGNTSNWDISSHKGRYWYFRWYQRWEANATYDGNHKLIYINSQPVGDFVLFIVKVDKTGLQVQLKDHATYSVVDTSWFSSPINLDNETWHKMELFIDAGTTGSKNGDYWIAIDDITIYSAANLRFNRTISSNPLHHVGWPSNASDESGSQQTWLDDLEVYILEDPNDIPSDDGSKADDGSSTISLAPPINLSVTQ